MKKVWVVTISGGSLGRSLGCAHSWFGMRHCRCTCASFYWSVIRPAGVSSCVSGGARVLTRVLLSLSQRSKEARTFSYSKVSPSSGAISSCGRDVSNLVVVLSVVCRACATFSSNHRPQIFFSSHGNTAATGAESSKKESRVMEQLSLEKVWSMGVNRRGIQTSSLKNFQKRAYPEDRRGVHCIFFVSR